MSSSQPVSIYGMNAQHLAKGVALVAHLKGVPFDFTTINLITGEQRGDAYKKIHPIGRCPSLTDGDFVLHEARAIARYLDKKSPLNPLVPTDPAQCAVFEEYMSIESCETWPRLNQVLRQELFTGIYNVPRDPVFIDRMISEVGPWLDMFEAALNETGAFICGPIVTLVDVFQFVVLEYFWFMLPEHKKSLFGPRPALTAWFERMLALPAWVELHETRKLAYLHDMFAAMAKAKAAEQEGVSA